MEALPKRHLLVAVDESEAAKRAFQWCLDNLYRENDVVNLFHVIPPGQYIMLSTDLGVEEVVEDDEATRRKVEDHARSYLVKAFVPKLEELKVQYQIEIVRFATDTDSIGSIICKRAEQLQAAAVVMAKHNKGAFKEFFVGSCTNAVARGCKSPVCILHAD